MDLNVPLERRGPFTVYTAPDIDIDLPENRTPESETPAHNQMPVAGRDRQESGNPECGRLLSHLARKILRAALEVLVGLRPLTHLTAYMTQTAYGRFAGNVRDTGKTRQGSASPKIRTLRICQPTSNVAEVAAVVEERSRPYAVVMRLEVINNQWRCSVFEIV